MHAVRANAGTTAAPWFCDLITSHLDELYVGARRFTDNAHDAADLAHDVVVKALRFADGFRRGTNFGAWMQTILTNTVYNTYTQRKRQPAPAVSEGAERAILSVTSRPAALLEHVPETIAEGDERFGTEVRRAMANLPGKYRRVLLLSALGEYRYREIAAILDIPVGTVMSRLFRARAMVREHLSSRRRRGGRVPAC